MSSSFKTIRATLEDGSIWEISALDVAHDRALHYADQEVKPNGLSESSEWREILKRETHFALNNKEVLLDWATNNMDDDGWTMVRQPQPPVFDSNKVSQWTVK